MKSSLWFFIFLLSIVSVAGAIQWQGDVMPVCPQGVCLEAGKAIFRVQVTNTGNDTLPLDQIMLVDDQGFVFGSWTFANGQGNVPQGKYLLVNVPAVVPAPTKGSTLYYKLGYFIQGKAYYDQGFRAMRVMPLTAVECVSNDFCDAGEACVAYKCVPGSFLKAMNITNVTVNPMPEQNTSFTTQDVLLLIAVLLLFSIAVTLQRRKPKA